MSTKCTQCEVKPKETEELMKSIATDLEKEDKPIKEMLGETAVVVNGIRKLI